MWGSRAQQQPQSQAQAQEPLRIEAFDMAIQGKRIAVVGDPEAGLGFIRSLEADQIYRGRSILVLQEANHGTAAALPSILLRHRWDFIVRVKEGFEAQILATYVANAPKPIRILWYSLRGSGTQQNTGEIPRALWSRWTQGVTLVGCQGDSFLGGCEWECIFFPPAHDKDKIERILAARGGIAATAQFTRIRDGVSEITASGAALVWSCVEEADTRAGGLYWYDPKEYSASLQWSAVDVEDTLRTIADWVGKKGAY